MFTNPPRPHRLLLFVLALLTLLGATLSTPTARATGPNAWFAWHLKVDFPAPAAGMPVLPRVLYTTYTASGDPTVVTNVNQRDISGDCTLTGVLTRDAAGYALFTNKAFVRCQLPAKPTTVTACTKGAFWVAADAKLNPKAASNPVAEGVANGNRAFGFALPVDASGKNATTVLDLAGKYTSPAWSITPGGANQALMGSGGPAMVDITKSVNTAFGYNWLGFMGGWQDAFDPGVTVNDLGHLVQPNGVSWKTARSGNFWTHPEFVDIGRSQSTNSYFDGALRTFEIDPPGCKSG